MDVFLSGKAQNIASFLILLNQVELCEKCGAPILNFLKRYKFIKPEKVKKKR